MSTRALYTFIGDNNFNIYKHCDGYPSGAAEVLKITVDNFAWQLPRYESDEFAAAFCAACKIQHLSSSEIVDFVVLRKQPAQRQFSGGGVRVMPSGKPSKIADRYCSDIEYRYEISIRVKGLYVQAFATNESYEGNLLFEGSFNKFYEWAYKDEA